VGSPDQEPVIIVEGLTARYGDVTILEDVSFEVFRGERFMILGGSGCGKSTLLKHMIGLLRPHAGRVIINGIDITRADEGTLHRVRSRLGVLFQADALFGSMSLAENVALPLAEYTDLPPELIREIVRMKLGLVNLAGTIGCAFSFLQGAIDRVFVDGAVELVGRAIQGAGARVRRIQTGRIQAYVQGLALGALALVALAYLLAW